MSKTLRNSLIVIVIVVVLFAIIWFVYDTIKKEPVETNVNANLVDGNTGLDNIINELFDNSIDNEQLENEVEQENKIENEVMSNDSEDKEENKVTTSGGSSTESVTTREEKAVELAKKEWGSTDGVYFSNESVDSQGRYIVSVRDKKTTASLAFYIVDVDKKLVTQQ